MASRLPLRSISKVDVESHAADLGEALADRRSLELGIDVFPPDSRVGIQMPVQRQRVVVERATLDVVAVEVDERAADRDFPRAAPRRDLIDRSHPKEILKGIDAIDRRRLLVVSAVLARQEKADEG